MKNFKNALILILLLIVPSIIIYIIHLVVFNDPGYILKDLLAQLAFLPLFYFFSTIVIDSILANREKSEIVKKINMLIGVYFSEMGTQLIKCFSKFDLSFETVKESLNATSNWSDKDFLNAKELLQKNKYGINSKSADLYEIKGYLLQKRSFLVTMMENQNLLEHETFTELTLAVFHLCEELENREDLKELPEEDFEHLSGDIKRAYILILVEWVNYMKHLKEEYPYLFSLAVRVNPFNSENKVVFGR